VDINQVYRAPSVPKLSKKNISSSVLRGGSVTSATPKLKTTKFSFIKPKISTESLKSEVSPVQVTETLVETNRILVEIQKQLSLDFAMRIAEEKETIKKVKTAESKRKFAAKEAAVESTKKITGAFGGVINKVAAPVKSVFDKIKEFFGLILTNVVLNVGFKWLQDPNNRKLFDTTIYWIGKAFIPAVITIVGFKLFKWVRRLYRLGRFLWRLPGRLLGLGAGAGSGPAATTGGGLFRTADGARRGITTQASTLRGADRYYGAGKPGLMEMNRNLGGGGPVQQFTRTKGPLAKSLQFAEVGAKRIGRNLLGALGMGPGKKTLTNTLLKFMRPFLKRIPFVGALIDFGLSVALGEDPGKAAFGAIGAALLGGLGTFLGGPVGTLLGGLAGDWAGRQLYDFFFKNKENSESGDVEKVKPTSTGRKTRQQQNRHGQSRKDGGTIYASKGMTVPGTGSGFVDSVRAMLAPGEEVIRTTSAMLFRPLLKDINDNAGRLWLTFSQAIAKLGNIVQYQQDVAKNYDKVISNFDEFLQKEVRESKGKKKEGGGGGFRPAPRSSPSLKPSVANVNLVMSGSSGSEGGMTVMPIQLPKQSSPPPQVPMPQTVATDAPTISPVNFLNPYMMLTPEMYGIFV